MKCGNWDIGVCSWSMQENVETLGEMTEKLGINCVHLTIAPALKTSEEKYLKAVNAQPWVISSTMIDFPQEDYSTLETIKRTGGIVPDECWKQNLQFVLRAIELTKDLNTKYLSFHAGFIDSRNPAAYAEICDRIKYLADAAEANKVTLLLETGQETADELAAFLEKLNHATIGVNFDPANMVLYNKGNPIEAVKKLAPWIKHVHIKDAVFTKTPGTWGTETIWGDGDVNASAFLRTLAEIGYTGALAIERESGDNRFEDIKIAVERLKEWGRQ